MSDEVYPKRILSLGAGVQSTTLLLMMIEGEIPAPDHVIFADTGWEPPKVYDHLTYLRSLMETAGIPFEIVSQGNIREDYLSEGRRAASMPLYIRNPDDSVGITRRQCTAEYKLKPLMRRQREIAGLAPGQRCKEHRVTTVIGISWDEVQRVKDPAFSWIKHEYPLIDRRLTRADCLRWCEDRGYPRPPRSACIGCPFKSNEEWRALRESPDDWADAVSFDDALRSSPAVVSRYRGQAFLHRSGIALRDVDLRSEAEKGILSLFDQECEGMCGL